LKAEAFIRYSLLNDNAANRLINFKDTRQTLFISLNFFKWNATGLD